MITIVIRTSIRRQTIVTLAVAGSTRQINTVQIYSGSL
jgi:hypothetical protein